jgi:DNA processing protein
LQPDADESILSLLGFDPMHPDVLAEQGQLSDSALAAQLLALELDGRIERLPDGRCLRRR